MTEFLAIPWYVANGETWHTVWAADTVDRSKLFRIAFSLRACTAAKFAASIWSDLSAYYSTMDPSEAQNAVNVLHGGGGPGDDLTSIWVIGWGGKSVHAVSEDGQPPEEDATKNCGLVIRDWRYVVRIANVNLRRLGGVTSLVTKAVMMIPTGKPVVYCCPGVVAHLINDWHWPDVALRPVAIRGGEPYVHLPPETLGARSMWRMENER